MKEGSGWFGKFWCGLHGHDRMMKFENSRISLRCNTCGHETPGWDLNEAPPKPSVKKFSRVRLVLS